MPNHHRAHNRWEDFPAFVRYISDGSQSPDLEGSPLQRVRWALNGTAADDFTHDDMLHTRAMSEWFPLHDSPPHSSSPFSGRA